MNTDELVTHAKSRFAHSAAKKILKEKYQAKLLCSYNGGLFKITPELLAFVATWPNDILYLLDSYENPIELDRQTFLTLAQQHYQEQMNAWHTEHSELSAQR